MGLLINTKQTVQDVANKLKGNVVTLTNLVPGSRVTVVNRSEQHQEILFNDVAPTSTLKVPITRGKQNTINIRHASSGDFYNSISLKVYQPGTMVVYQTIDIII